MKCSECTIKELGFIVYPARLTENSIRVNDNDNSLRRWAPRMIKNMLGRIGYESKITNDPDAIFSASKLILPVVDYDGNIIQQVSKAVSIPVIAIGGAGSEDDSRLAIKAGASAISAGSMFVFQRTHRAVLISYPYPEQYDFK